MNIINEKDDEISAKANSMWREMIMHSNDGNYSEFIKHFSPSLMLGLNEVEVGRQFSTSELTRSLSDDFDELGIIRRGEHVTVLFRQRSSKREGEWLGRLVLGYDEGEIRVFGASIF
ncbi:MAG: hypothetical protein HOM03_12595 [Marinovum sp.]|jgi:hypothetical protein|nr:hypothetical protein [Marinovum sp.]MBT6098013.1 hypothetical protein [Marinovum sp.]MBT6533792.1 hypothetical protein [Marinovum sp.]